MDMTIREWGDVREAVLELARQKQVMPFVGAGISVFAPTAMPAGREMLHSALRGVFREPQRFISMSSENWRPDERQMELRSPEVVLQGLFEGLPDTAKAYSPYDGLVGAEPNPIHVCLAHGLTNGSIPAVLSTNPDDCIERAAQPGAVTSVYAASEFDSLRSSAVYHMHGICSSPSDAERVEKLLSLANTLNQMGPRLPGDKRGLLERVAEQHSLLFVGYSGSDPDVWYSLDELLAIHDA